MSIPRQVEENARMAEELLERSFAPDSEEDEPGGEEEDAAAAPSEDPEPTVEPEPSDDDLTFKERYLTLKGKYDAEVPRLSSELKEFKQAVLERLGSEPSQAEPEAAPEPDPEDPVLAQFREEFGDEHADLMIKLINAQGQKLVKESLKTSLTPVEEKVKTVEDKQLEAARNDFAQALDTKLETGNWRQLMDGSNPKFVEFLGEADPSGLFTYGELVQEFSNRWDSDKLAKVFKTFLERETPVKAPTAKPDALIAPSRSTNTNPPVETDKILWTKESIKQFQKDDMSGKLSAEESKRLWDDLLLAPGEDRIK